MPDASGRQMVLTSDFEDDLFFLSMHGREEVSRLYEYQVSALSPNPALAADDILGTAASVAIEATDDVERHFHGLVTAFGLDGMVGRYYRYRLVLRPWLWLLTRSADVRIFQQKNALAILDEIFGKYEHSLANEASASPAARDYCVQYRETDFAFVSRLLEEEGISYRFRHSADGHELVLFDQATQLAPGEGFDTVRFYRDPGVLAEVEGLSAWRMQHEIQSGKLVVRDWNFETPSTDLLSTVATASHGHANAAFEVYDHPARHAVKADGDTIATHRLDALQSGFARYTGEGNVTGLAAGALFTLAEHDRDELNIEYVVLASEIALRVAGFEGGGDEGDTAVRCSVLAQPSSAPLRPALRTPRPVVGGPQTAIVVGDADAGDILTDKYGRVKVQFHWDRVGTKTAESSCWIRVASPMAGNGWGMITVPRIGQEVVVDFLEGDPDRPLITGRVYNAEQMPPYELPANATVSTVRSNSKLKDVAHFNELRFEDKPGDEHVWFQAERDFYHYVKHDKKVTVDNDEFRIVKRDQIEKIERDVMRTIERDRIEKIGRDQNADIAGKLALKVGDAYGLKVASDAVVEAGAAVSLKSGADMVQKVGSNLGVEAAANVHIKGGANVVIEAGAMLTLKCGGASVVIGPANVMITGTMVMINSGGGGGSGGGANPKTPEAPQKPTAAEEPADPLA